MFEYEIRELSTVKRWSIVRTIGDQSVAEHSFNTAMYANDLCLLIGMTPEEHLAVLKYAMWHDMEEIYTGDIPGPAKKKIVHKDFKDVVAVWIRKTFNALRNRRGPTDELGKHIVKIADMMDSAFELTTESLMGNMRVDWMAKQHTALVVQMIKELPAFGVESAIADTIQNQFDTAYGRAIMGVVLPPRVIQE